MAYTLHRLAPGSYDLLLDGTIIGSVVQDVLPGGGYQGWRAELLDDGQDVPKPVPFSEAEHTFATLVDVQRWLGGAMIVEASKGP